ncbi:MAG: Transcriptional regulator, MarR family [Myxococcales bacterium]|nr:Transcriptional regulator, MarR family [Myxococcales bacterium]
MSRDKAQRWQLDDAIGFWMHLTQNRMRTEADRVMAPFAVNPEQWALLVRLWERDDRSPAELADATFRDRASVTRMLDGLVSAGYVLRAADPEDGRRQRIVLTRAGRELEEKLVPTVRAFVAHLLRGISAGELQTTLATLRRLYHNLD